MKAMPIPSEGGCRCGALRFRLTAPPLITMACHCRGCQKMTASAYSLGVAVPAQGFAIIAGEPVRGGLREAPLHHMHCPQCMSWAFTRIDGLDQMVNVRATLLDDPSWYEPFMETQTVDKLPWAATSARRSFEGFPRPEEFPALIGEFMAQAL